MNDKRKGESQAWDVRSVNYSLEVDAGPKRIGKPADFCQCAITEHQKESKLTVGDGTQRNNGLFEDTIGPHGSTTGFTHSTRYFTVVLDGANLGTVQINDRFGYHTNDDIKIDSKADTTELNGTLKPTDLQ
jgi:hypothetical protein